VARYPPWGREQVYGYIIRDVGIELWNKVKSKATLECKTVRVS
jgi:hypothetical protein